MLGELKGCSQHRHKAEGCRSRFAVVQPVTEFTLYRAKHLFSSIAS